MDVSARQVMLLKGWTRRRFGLVAGGAATALLGLGGQPEALARYGHGHHHGNHRDRHGVNRGHHGRNKPGNHAQAQLQPVGGSGVSGFVTLNQLGQGGTNIVVQADGLTPGTEYLSLYYDNST